MDKLRIDKWLWAARFYKTRSLAGEEIDKGRVRINDVEAKPAKEVKVGDVVAMRSGPSRFWVLARNAAARRLRLCCLQKRQKASLPESALLSNGG
jgi:ribosome-associated heat shock protein Hsp15